MTLEMRLKHYRLTIQEYERAKSLLGRELKPVEWPLFSALWSEHCSYKSSKVHLRKFAKTLTQSAQGGTSENAGVVDLGRGERIIFKMESHNHPSFIEPYQGAATGVGGILRDIFTMGARPIASADYLCFGDPKAPRMRALVDGVVRGIGGYGNSVGVPTVTGQTQFDPRYNNNILVNAMSVGLLVDGEPLALSAPKRAGEFVVYVGARTGSDGVHGAAMASESFGEDSEAKRPNVQIGDPFFEKLLIESSLEVIQKGWVQAIQDMGAAGLTSSSFEMSAKGGLGFDLSLDEVPLRSSELGPEEILLSESQERMLLVCRPEDYASIQKVFERWGLEAKKIGVVRDRPEIILRWKGEVLTEIDPRKIVDEAPVFERAYDKWSFPRKTSVPSTITPLTETLAVIEQRLKSPVWSDRHWITRQYDQRVGGKTARGAESDVGVLRLPLSGRGLGLCVGTRTAWMKRDARIGALDAILYPALQMALKGLRPVGATDCLNFGNPERTVVMSEFVASVDAISEICVELGIPVVSGNVSFYNETLGQGIPPTPAIGLMGLRESVDHIPPDEFQQQGSALLLFEIPWVEEVGSEQWGELEQGLSWKEKLHQVQAISMRPEVLSSQMVGEGGLLWSLIKMSSNSLGFEWTGSVEPLRSRLYQGILEVPPDTATEILNELRSQGFKAEEVGQTLVREVKIGSKIWSTAQIQELRRDSWRNWIEGVE